MKRKDATLHDALMAAQAELNASGDAAHVLSQLMYALREWLKA